MLRILFLFFTVSVYAQGIQNSDRPIIWKDSLFLFNQETVSVAPIKATTSFSFSSRSYKAIADISAKKASIISTDEAILFLDQMGGAVYAFESDSLIRIDKSYKHRMQIDASLFVKNDTVFKFGGYGFWSVRNFLTFFDGQTKEWEVYAPKNSDLIPEGTSASYASLLNDEIIFFGGDKLNPFDQVDFSPSNDIWKFNFKSKKWTFLGKSNIDFTQIKGVVKMGHELLFIEDKYLKLINPFENSIKLFQKNTLHYRLSTATSRGLNPLFYNNQFYCFVNSNATENIGLEVRGVDEFFGPIISETKLYNDFNYLWLLGVFPLLGFGYYSFKAFRKFKAQSNAMRLHREGIVYKNIFYNLSDHEYGILQCLLDAVFVDTSTILEIVENKDHNYSHNMRTKNKIIGELNYKLKTILKIDKDLVVSKKSDKDRRIIIYTIDKSFFSL